MNGKNVILGFANVVAGVVDFLEEAERGTPTLEAASRALARSGKRQQALANMAETMEDVVRRPRSSARGRARRSEGDGRTQQPHVAEVLCACGSMRPASDCCEYEERGPR